MKVFTFISVHAWETNTYARVNLLEMSTYKSCWRWPVSQFSIWNRGIDFKIPRLTGSQLWTGSPLDQRTVHRLTDRQMYTFPDQRNWQFVQVLMDSKVPLKTSCTGHRWRKAKDFFVFCSGKICLVLYKGWCSFELRHLCLVHKINAQTPITTILATHLSHEFIVNCI